MMNEQRRFIHDVLASLLELPGSSVIWQHQNRMPKQKWPYATLRIYSLVHEVSPEFRHTGKPGTLNVFVPTTAVIEVQVFDAGDSEAYDRIEKMIRGLERPTIVDKCVSARVAFFDVENTVDLTALQENQTWESRAAVDLHIRYNSEIEDTPGYIGTVHIDGETLVPGVAEPLPLPIEIEGGTETNG